MNGCETIKRLMKDEHIKQIDIANAMGVNPRNIGVLLTRQKDLKVGRFIELLEYIGYSFELKKVNRRRISKNAIEIPTGICWYEDDGKYIVISNQDGVQTKNEFSSQEECFAYMDRL